MSPGDDTHHTRAATSRQRRQVRGERTPPDALPSSVERAPKTPISDRVGAGWQASDAVGPPGAPDRHTALLRIDGRRDAILVAAYVSAIVVGAALIVATAAVQPYHNNELVQIGSYGAPDLGTAVSGTRQPPLGPAVGVLAQRVFGIGQLTQRLEAIVPGVGTLVVLSVLFWRLGLGSAGAFAMWALATTPLMMRYSAYARPYALPLFLMVLCTYLLYRWLATARSRYLLGVLAAAALAPLARVPEPTAYLLVSVVVLVVLGLRRRHSWRRVLPPLGAIAIAIVFVALPMYLDLRASSPSLAESDPLALLTDIGPQLSNLVTVVPWVLSYSFPLWPLVLAVVVAACVVPDARRWLVRTWPAIVLLVPPVAWAIYYHIAVRRVSEGVLGLVYRPRFAYFFVVPLAFAVAALARVVVDPHASLRTRRVLAAALVAMLIGQLPGVVYMLREHDNTPDWAAAARMISELPSDAVVLFDNTVPYGAFRSSFLGQDRYWAQPITRVVVASNDFRWGPRPETSTEPLEPDRPLYMLLLGPNAEEPGCPLGVNEAIAAPVGWRPLEHDRRFSLFAPTGPDMSPEVVDSWLAFAEPLPLQCSLGLVRAAAVTMVESGDEEGARQLLTDALDTTLPERRSKIWQQFNDALPGLVELPTVRQR